MIINVLAERYASRAMRDIWSRESKIRMEREFWISVMKIQSRLGMKISDDTIRKYESVVKSIDIDAIDRRERSLRHDVKARIEEFNSLAGLELIHLGMTSRDLTENIEMAQIKESLTLIRSEVIGVLNLLSNQMKEFSDLVMVGRSHNVPAQL
ncbi:MAG: adenylosuccinate lyase, partial [Candidatus Nanopelagicaceae bacterium]